MVPNLRVRRTPVGVGLNICERYFELRLVNYMRVKHCEKEVRKKVLHFLFQRKSTRIEPVKSIVSFVGEARGRIF